jgi:luciferase family oxidoreductase group 1
MNTSLNLGILDLCKRSTRVSAGESLRGTLALAEEADRAGYRRYWVAEHHVEDSAEACPEVLIPLIAARTKHLSVGSGGVLMRYYSPLKVAETFLTLEALFPGRIELGVAKGPGVVSAAIADALVCGNRWELSDDAFERKVFELKQLLDHAYERGEADPQAVRARPYGVPPPPLWVLGSGSKSQDLASGLGVSYACALIFNGGMAAGPKLLEEYRARYLPSLDRPAPRACIAVSAMCMENEEDAIARDLQLTQKGMLKSNIVGTPAQCAAQLRELARVHASSEILVASWLEDPAERIMMYRSIAEACELPGQRRWPHAV